MTVVADALFVMQLVEPGEDSWDSAPGQAAGRHHFAFVERFACFGLALLLLISGGFALFWAHSTTSGLGDAQLASARSERYQEARYVVAGEASLDRTYRPESGAEVRAGHLRAETAFAASIQAAAAGGNPNDLAQDAALLRIHQKYVAASASMFAAVDARRPGLARLIDQDLVDPLLGFVQSSLFARAAQQRATAALIVSRLDALQRGFVITSIALWIASVLYFIAYTAVLSAYKRQLLEAHKVELRQWANAALVDHLTGIGNHRAYREDIAREVSRAARHGETLTLALVDIDEMKLINDQSGHLHGDRILAMLGTLLQQLRAEDRSFRLGGDQFGVLLPRTSAHDARELMDRLRKTADTALLGATLSIGIASLIGHECDAETFHDQADAALYAAKRAGRNACVTFDAATDEMWLLSPGKVRQLRNLIANEAVSVAFQPIWDVAECNILAYEALARPAAEYGFNGPQDVFDLAERVGRAHEIDAVCRRATLKRAHEVPDNVLLFINMSPQSLDHGHLDPLQFAAEVIGAGLTPQRIVIEITERSIVHLDVVISVAKQLQQLGFRLALDDTGAGNAGLEMLSALQVDFVKIDRGIIVKALTDKRARGVMAGIVAIARETGAYVIAEGIEDIEMLELACGQGYSTTQHRGVRGVQGYLLRRPSEAIVHVHDADDARSILQEVVVRHQAIDYGSSLPTERIDAGRR